MSTQKVRVAIIGLGFGAEFIPIYQRHPNAEMYAICRRDQKELDAVGDRFGSGGLDCRTRGAAVAARRGEYDQHPNGKQPEPNGVTRERRNPQLGSPSLGSCRANPCYPAARNGSSGASATSTGSGRLKTSTPSSRVPKRIIFLSRENLCGLIHGSRSPCLGKRGIIRRM
jgi:hypothetical protein